VLSVAVFRAFTTNEYITREYIEDVHRHAQLTARIASAITLNSPSSPFCTLAALLHDIGKLVMAERIPAHLARARHQAEEEHMPLYQVEESLIQISHAEVGAYLLSMWGFPPPIVEAVAHHHHPRRVPHNGLDIVFVVYAANLLAAEREAIARGAEPPAFDMELFEQTGAAPLLADWRTLAEAAFANQAQLVN
jgi:putative nucleotidyltransferase with HDIG domain